MDPATPRDRGTIEVVGASLNRRQNLVRPSNNVAGWLNYACQQLIQITTYTHAKAAVSKIWVVLLVNPLEKVSEKSI